MDGYAYFISLSNELDALKDRVRNFISDRHWQTDGEWKESVLRITLRRHLPSSVEVGRGFIITKDSCSNQMDILIYDTSKPILYRDGDLVFVTGDAVRGIIEVKSNLDITVLSEALDKLGDNVELINNSRDKSMCNDLFVGLFSYDTSLRQNRSSDILRALKTSAQGKKERAVNHLCLGQTMFIRFWPTHPDGQQEGYNRWRSYDLQRLSPGYFINNVVEFVAELSVKHNRDLWFPLESKEITNIDEVEL